MTSLRGLFPPVSFNGFTIKLNGTRNWFIYRKGQVPFPCYRLQKQVRGSETRTRNGKALHLLPSYASSIPFLSLLIYDPTTCRQNAPWWLGEMANKSNLRPRNTSVITPWSPQKPPQELHSPPSCFSSWCQLSEFLFRSLIEKANGERGEWSTK